MESKETVTQLLAQWRGGNREAQERLLPLVYEELRRLAGRHMRRESPGHTLQPTDLVHEAFLRLMDADVDWKDQVHFQSVASRVMRRVLVDHARAKQAEKRGGDLVQVTLGTEPAETPLSFEDVLTLDQALAKLEAFDERKCRIVELIYFGGLEHEQIGRLLDVSRTTIHRELKFARAWLKREMGDQGEH